MPDLGPPPLNESSIVPGSEEELWLRRHPLYIKLTQRGYPLPIGEFEILALKKFTPVEYGGDAANLACF